MLLQLLIGVVGVHVGAARGVPLSESDEVARAVGTAIERHSGRRVEVDRPDWEQCPEAGPCVEAVRARLRAQEVLLLSVVGGPLQLFVRAQLIAQGEPQEVTLKVPRPDAKKPEAWAALAERLFAPKPLAPPPRAVATATPTAASPYPWIAGSVGAAAVAGGIAFGSLSRSTVGEIESMAHTPERRASLDSRASTQATMANVFFAVAVTSAITAVVLWAID